MVNEKISNELRIARNLFDSGYAGRAKLSEMGYSVLLDGRVFYHGKPIGNV